MSRVDLGFLEKADPWQLKSNYFPSKVGGKPAWLALKNLPSPENLQCKKCGEITKFLCQVYAPFEDNVSCFHRTLFVFICKNEDCCVRNSSDNLLIFRSQLQRNNEFYSSEPPVETLEASLKFSAAKFVKLCALCGVFASKHCSKCKITPYCSREHQISDWKLRHKKICGTEDSKDDEDKLFVFHEWELVIEAEENSHKAKETTEEEEEKQMNEFQNLVAEGKAGTMTEVSEEDLEAHAAVDEDKTFSAFRKRVKENPDQVLRYNRGGSPLWIAKDPVPGEIPACEICESPREFEFQIMPQILYSLREDKLDWGVIAVYTCKNSCDSGPTYKKEFVFKQDVTLPA